MCRPGRPPEDNHPQLTAKELATLFGLARGSVNSWHARGLLTLVGYRRSAVPCGGWENLYCYWEAVHVERATRHSSYLRVPRRRITVTN